MILIATIPMLTMLGGGILYTATEKPKASEIGRLMFLCGLLVTLYVLGGYVVRVP